MKQIGVVTEVQKKIAIIQIKRTSACGGKCSSCSGCETTPHKVKAYNMIDAQIGQIVQLEMKDSRVLGAAFIIYVIPLIMLFVGYGIGNILFGRELYAGATGVVLLTFSFIILKLMDKRLNRSEKFMPVITNTIEK